MNEQDHTEVEATAARGGETPHVARYVLMFSVALVVAAFAVLLIIWS
jgi:hypothetical protein